MSEHAHLPSIDAVFTELVDSVAVYERNGCIVYLNPTTEQLFGLKTEAVRSQIIWELFPAARGTPFHQPLRASGQGWPDPLLRALLRALGPLVR